MESQDTVILVHGLWLHGVAMWLMKRRLEESGFAVRVYSYPTVRLDLRQNSDRLRRYCQALGSGKLHFVGHSMGGLLALKAAELVPPACRGRAVLVGTPYAGCYSACALQRWPGGRRILGQCMGEWLAAERSAMFDACELGVLAGTGGIGLGRLIAPGLPRPHDGVVSVDETRVPGMCDHLQIEVSHTQMLISRAVARQVCAFLSLGKFDRTQATEASVN